MRHFPNTDVMHEAVCPKCKKLRYCTCGSMFAHQRDEPFPNLESTWCASCRAQFHDPSRDPDDAADQRAYDSFNRFGR